MSLFLKLIMGTVRSNTVQFNSVVLTVLTALIDTQFIQDNPDYVKIGIGLIALVNLLLRAKTKMPLIDR